MPDSTREPNRPSGPNQRNEPNQPNEPEHLSEPSEAHQPIDASGRPDQNGQAAQRGATKPKKTLIWLLVAAVIIAAIALAAALVVPKLLQDDANNTSAQPTTPTSDGEEAEPDTEDDHASDASDSETPPTDAPATPVVLPECEALNPEAYAHAKSFSESYPSEVPYGEIDVDLVSAHFGPAAQQALGTAAETRACTYPIHIEAGVRVLVSELAETDRAALLAALRGDPDFIESQDVGAEIFVWTEPQTGGHWDKAVTAHVFVGEIWLATFGPEPYDDYTARMTEAILSANPSRP